MTKGPCPWFIKVLPGAKKGIPAAPQASGQQQTQERYPMSVIIKEVTGMLSSSRTGPVSDDAGREVLGEPHTPFGSAGG